MLTPGVRRTGPQVEISENLTYAAYDVAVVARAKAPSPAAVAKLQLNGATELEAFV
jgi:hypothetical protein